MGAGQNFIKWSSTKLDLVARDATRWVFSLITAYRSTPRNTIHEAARRGFSKRLQEAQGNKLAVQGAARRGFSLVELMITIAVLGVLASISIPTYISYSKRAMQAEARSTLMGIFAAEKNFYSEWGVYVGTLPIAGYEPAGDYSYMAGFSADFKGSVSCDDAATNIEPIVHPSTGVGVKLSCGPRLVKFTGSIPADIGGGQDSLGCTSTWQCDNVFGSSTNHKCKSKKCKWVGPQLAFGGNLTTFKLKAKPYIDPDPDLVSTFVGVDQFKAVALSCLQSSCNSLGAADAWSVNHKKNMVHVKDGLD